jgi:hypothetical protein
VIPTTYIVQSERTNPIFGKAFAHGCGGRIEYGNRLRWAGPVALFGSPARWALIEEAMRLNRTLYYGDHGYLRRRQFYRITKDGFQHDGTGNATADRFRAIGRPVQPWQSGGRHILLCPNSPTYFGLFKMDVYQWVNDVTAQLALHSDRPVRVRWKGHATPIEEDLVGCHAVVVFSSAAAIDGLIAGVPCFTLANFAGTKRMGHTDLSLIESPMFPADREPFLWNLSDNQWSLEEIRDGVAWKALSQHAEVERAS